MRLTIAEKPQDGSDIARVLGATRREDGYFHGNGEFVTWVRGHLVELAEPEDYDADLRPWRRETLPIVPAEFRYRVLQQGRAQFNVIKSLIARQDVTEIVNACDAAREGELIFDLVCRLAGNTKPTLRLWMRSKTDDDIRACYRALRPSSEYAGLLAAAHARQRGDWLIGINCTRALSLAAGTRRTYSIGRVITPTVALVVARDEAIEGFRATPYYEAAAKFSAHGQEYAGYYFMPPPPHGASQEKRVHRFDDETVAARLVSQLPPEATVVSAVEREVSVKQPLLYDLTQLQREANTRHGIPTQDALDAAQSLWDLKLITYPRSASQHLSTSINAEIGKHLSALAAIKDPSFSHVARAATHAVTSGYALTRRHVDDKKLTEGHHAIIPSCVTPDLAALDQTALRVYELIARRFLAAFFPAARDARTEIVTACGGFNFLTRGSRELSAGWRALDPPSRGDDAGALQDDDAGDETAPLPKLNAGERVSRCEGKVLSKKTRAPQRYTEASLLEAMESAGQHCETEEERLAMKVCGLGMPSTRTPTITKAFKLGYFEREGRRIIRSTAVAREVVRRLRSINSVLVSPSLTGKWESELARIASGVKDSGQFDAGVALLTRMTVDQIFSASAPSVSSNAAFEAADGVGECPQCRLAGRRGVLRVRSGTAGKFFACSLPRAECGYVSDYTARTTERRAITERRCPECKSAMRLRHSRENQTPYLCCTRNPDCNGVYFFDRGRGQSRRGDRDAAA
jgi:DNA topoisomerase-3